MGRAKSRPKAAKTAIQSWHPCDDFLVPLGELLYTVSADKNYAPISVDQLIDFVARGDRFLFGVNWLELNESPQFAENFRSRLEGLTNEVMRGHPSRWKHAPDWALLPPKMVQEQMEANWLFELRPRVENAWLWLIQLAGLLRSRVTFDSLALKPHFVPTDLQRLLLETLRSRKMTQHELMTELNIGSKETFNGKGGKGGMKELIDLKLVAKDARKGGGYYRPDAPPESVL